MVLSSGYPRLISHWTKGWCCGLPPPHTHTHTHVDSMMFVYRVYWPIQYFVLYNQHLFILTATSSFMGFAGQTVLTSSSSKQYSIHSTSIMVSSKHQEFKPLRWLEFLMLWRYHNLHQGIWINLLWQSNFSFIWFSSQNGNLCLSDAVHQTWQGNRNIWRLPRKLLLFLAT